MQKITKIATTVFTTSAILSFYITHEFCKNKSYHNKLKENCIYINNKNNK